jgi:hypothetical protein
MKCNLLVLLAATLSLGCNDELDRNTSDIYVRKYIDTTDWLFQNKNESQDNRDTIYLSAKLTTHRKRWSRTVAESSQWYEQPESHDSYIITALHDYLPPMPGNPMLMVHYLHLSEDKKIIYEGNDTALCWRRIN